MATHVPASRSRRTWTKAAPVLVLAAACLAAFWSARRRTDSLVANEGLVVPEAALSLGEVWESASFEWALPVHNPTDRELTITGFSTFCNCASITPDSSTILPGQTTTFRLKLNLVDEKGVGHPRDVSILIIPLIAGSHLFQQGWTLTGRVRRVLSAEPSRMSVPPIVCGSDGPRHRLRMHAHAPIHSTRASCALATVSIQPAAERDGYLVDLDFHKSLPARYHRSELVVEALDPSAKSLGCTKVPVDVLVLHRVAVTPATIVLDRHCNRHHQEVLVLTSHINQPFKVEDVRTNSPAVSIGALSGTHDHFHVAIDPRSYSTSAQAISFVITDSIGRFTVDVPIRR